MSDNWLEWVQLFLRWFHVLAAITWIGQTYLFNWMERNMQPAQGKGAEGELWMVHGGGFWRLEKLMVPEKMPASLLWFKWEAGLTWLSGMLLLVVHYYAVGAMVEAHKPPISHGTAVVVGVGALVVGFVVYNAVMLSPLGRNELVGAAIGIVLVMAAAWGLRQVLNARAAYVHVGAILGTIMVANVWMRIIPTQRALIAARNAGAEPDLERAERAKRSSKHNSYMSVPVVFMMISHHFLSVVGHAYAWAILGGLTLVGFVAQRLFRGPAR